MNTTQNDPFEIIPGRYYWYSWSSRCEAVIGECVDAKSNDRILIRYNSKECRIVERASVICEAAPPANPRSFWSLWR